MIKKRTYKKQQKHADRQANEDQQNKAQENHVKMTETPVPKLILELSVSTVVSMLAGATYNLTDSFFVSKLGSSATAAVGVIFSIMALIQAVGYTFGIGAGSSISRLLGKKNREEADRIASCAFAAAIVAGLVLMTVGLCILKWLMGFLGATETIREYAMEYGRYILIAAPIMCSSYVLNNILRSEGKPIWALLGISIGGVVNIALNPLLIFTCNLGIKGAGIATIAGQAVGLVLMYLSFFKDKSVVHLKLKGLFQKLQVYFDIIKMGLPSFWRQGLVCLAGILLNRRCMEYGDDAMAAMSVSNKIFAVLFAALVGYGQGFSPVAGYNFGAKKYDRVKTSVTFSTVSATLIMSIIGAAVFIWAKPLISCFSKEQAVLDLGVYALRAHSISLPFLPICLMAGMLFQAIGAYGKATLLSAARQGIFFLPLIWLLPAFFQVKGIAVTQATSDIISGLFAVPFLIYAYKQLKSWQKQNCS